MRWATVDQPKLAAEQQRTLLEGRIRAHGDADTVLDEFNSAA